MAILKDVRVYFVKCDPKRPSKQFSPDNPRWDVQIITDDPNKKNEWMELGLKAKLMIYKEGDPKEGEPILNSEGKKQWKMSLSKNSLKREDGKKDGKLIPSEPVDVIDGNKDPVDPNTIANGSLCNVRVYLYEYPSKKVPGTIAIGHVLMGIQVLEHIVYTPKPKEEFDNATTTRITPKSDDDDDDDQPDPGSTQSSPKVGADNLPEDKF